MILILTNLGKWPSVSTTLTTMIPIYRILGRQNIFQRVQYYLEKIMNLCYLFPKLLQLSLSCAPYLHQFKVLDCYFALYHFFFSPGHTPHHRYGLRRYQSWTQYLMEQFSGFSGQAGIVLGATKLCNTRLITPTAPLSFFTPVLAMAWLRLLIHSQTALQVIGQYQHLSESDSQHYSQQYVCMLAFPFHYNNIQKLTSWPGSLLANYQTPTRSDIGMASLAGVVSSLCICLLPSKGSRIGRLAFVGTYCGTIVWIFERILEIREGKEMQFPRF